MKRLLCVFLVVLLVSSIMFQCSITSSAIAGVDDVVVLGVCLDLLALGISIHSVEQFCQSDRFADFCRDVGNHIDTGITTMRRNGRLFVATTKLAWQDLCTWVKSKFRAGDQNKSIEFQVNTPTDPTGITLTNGITLPYDEFMIHPFFVYQSSSSPGTYHAYCCTGTDVGAFFYDTSIQIYCLGTNPKVQHWYTTGGSWTYDNQYNMTSGASYMNTRGYLYNLRFSSGSHMSDMSKYLYRTMNKIVNTDGTVDTTSPPANQIPDEYEPTPAVVVASSDPVYYPGSVDAPADVIANNDLILIPVPDNLIEESVPGTPDLTTSLPDIAHTVASTTPADVKTYVYNNYYTNIVDSPADIIEDTPDVVIPQEDVNDPALDIETANKFRLPKSFLEGFPFSIPYSIYVGIQSFVADPVAPSFSIPFSIPRLGIDENMVLDLNQFSPLARLCRALLSLVWVAGLAMACSKFIKR